MTSYVCFSPFKLSRSRRGCGCWRAAQPASNMRRICSLKHRWSSGRIRPCHGRDPGSIPGRCSNTKDQSFFFFFVWAIMIVTTKHTGKMKVELLFMAFLACSWTADCFHTSSCFLKLQKANPIIPMPCAAMLKTNHRLCRPSCHTMPCLQIIILAYWNDQQSR